MRPLALASRLVPLALAGVLLALPAHADDSSPYGINAHTPAGPLLAPQLDAVQQAGIGWIRIDLIWAVVQPQRGIYDWSLYDALVAAAQQRGLSILAIIAYTPQWATDGPILAGVPRDVNDWTAFCTRAVARYRGRIAAWEVWNEPNLPQFWSGTRQQYWDGILVPAADAIHAGDPQAKVAGPALAHLDSHEWYDWLYQTLLTAGDRIDVITHHVYDSDGYGSVTDRLEASTRFGSDPGFWGFSAPSVREVLKAANARSKPFWLTETGWESSVVGEGAQADNYAGILGQWLAGDPGRAWVQKIFFYELQDGPDFTWGVRRQDGSAKPAYDAYQAFIGAHSAAPSLLLQNSRFALQASWRTPDGQSGVGTPLPFSEESGRFWFFSPGNTELAVKMLDGSTVNGHEWLYWGALSDVEYWLTVTDRQTGAIKRYHNPPGTLCGGGDVNAFALSAPAACTSAPAGDDVEPSPVAAWPAAASSCAAGAQTLCLGSNRFAVQARWHDPHSGATGNASTVAADADSGSFWFFTPGNLELVVKVLDGRAINNHFWVYFGALSDVEYWVTVTDTATGATRAYHNRPGTLCGQGDTQAF